jgi:hypothetical protein
VGGTTGAGPCKDPCAAKNAIEAKFGLPDRIANLQNSMNNPNLPPGTELARVFRTDGTTGHFRGTDENWAVTIPYDHYRDVMHTHPDEAGTLYFSAGDILWLYTLLNGGYIGDGEDFFFGVVTSSGDCSFLHIIDPDAFRDFVEWFEDKEHFEGVMGNRLFHEDWTDDSLLSRFIQFLDYFNSGLTFIMGMPTNDYNNPIDWQVKEAGPNDTLTNKDCDEL